MFDRATGKPLAFDVVGSAIARAGGVRNNDTTQTYIRVTLARPVPPDGGEARVLIDKTYEDATSYFVRGDTIVFTRPLGIKRNAVVLPKGYELISSSFPSQVLQEPDGRVGISFWNTTPVRGARSTLRARPVARSACGPVERRRARLDERAHQNREIVYFLQQPETHAFDLYHDYTESRVGHEHVPQRGARGQHRLESARAESRHRRGSQMGGPQGRARSRRRSSTCANVTPESEVVVFRFAPVKQGESVRLRMFETYTDTARYKLVGDELVWDRSFGRPANAVVLPAAGC